MTEPKTDFEEIQKQLDEKKYYQSQTAQRDLSGLMSYCSGCEFRRIETNQAGNYCNIDHENRKLNHCCARNYYRRKNDEKSKTSNTRRKNNRKS